MHFCVHIQPLLPAQWMLNLVRRLMVWVLQNLRRAWMVGTAPLGDPVLYKWCNNQGSPWMVPFLVVGWITKLRRLCLSWGLVLGSNLGWSSLMTCRPLLQSFFIWWKQRKVLSGMHIDVGGSRTLVRQWQKWVKFAFMWTVVSNQLWQFPMSTRVCQLGLEYSTRGYCQRHGGGVRRGCSWGWGQVWVVQELLSSESFVLNMYTKWSWRHAPFVPIFYAWHATSFFFRSPLLSFAFLSLVVHCPIESRHLSLSISFT